MRSLAALLLWAMPAAAQTADGPIMGSTGSQPVEAAPAASQPAPADQPDQPGAADQPPPTEDNHIVEILSIGDALGGGAVDARRFGQVRAVKLFRQRAGHEPHEVGRTSQP